MANKPDPVDALLKAGPRRTRLPEPAERARLRTDYGLTQTEIAAALEVTRTTVAGWEAGRSEPQGATRAAYAKLLEGIATQLAAVPPPPTAHAVSAPRPDVATEEPQPAKSTGATRSTIPTDDTTELVQPLQAAPSIRPAPPASNTDAAPHAATMQPVQSTSTVHPARPAQPVQPVQPAQGTRGASVGTERAGAPPARRGASASPAARTAAGTPVSRRSSAVRPAREPATAQAAVDPAFAHGPLAVLDGDGAAYCVGGRVLDCPATTIPALVDWALTEARLGAPRLNRNGKDADPLVVVTAAAAERLGLPAELEDRRGLRLPADHPVNLQIARARWQTTKRGFGPWARVYRPAQAGRRQCVQFAIVPWGALDPRAWGDAADLPAADLAQVLGAYATRVITPRGSCAVSGLELMTALRPPTRAVKDAATGAWSSGPNPGALTAPVDPAPPEAPDEHPVVAALCPRGHRRTPAEVLDEEAYEWIRDPELLTDEECARPYAVGIDVNMAFAAAANRLNVGIGPAEHFHNPAFDPKLPGSWLVDLSHVDIDPRLPSPFTPHGERPAGPAWYATPTVAYAVELGYEVRPAEAYVRPQNAAYLDGWYTRLRDAYMVTMERLGVVAGMREADFLKAMDEHKQVDAQEAAVLSAVKATVKGGIGKLRERPQGIGYRPGERWPALERPTWRPDIRAAVISAARINMHRKMLKLAGAGLFPIAVLSDCAVYLSDGPSPLDFLPRTPDDKPLPGGFRLGVSPGMVKCEGSRPMMWAVQMLDQGHNPARHIKGGDASADGE